MSWQPAVSGKRQLTWARLNRCRLVDSARHRRADRTRLCSLSIVLDRGAECRLVAIVHDLIKTKREYVAEIERTKEREREGREAGTRATAEAELRGTNSWTNCVWGRFENHGDAA